MPIGEPSTSVYLPQLVAELPDGWTVSEGMTISSPSGTKVRVSLDHAPPGSSAEELTKSQLSQATIEVDDFNDGTAAPLLAFGGLEGYERSFTFARDGASFKGLITSAVIGDLAVSSGASWGAERDDEVMVRSVLQGLRLIGRPTLMRPVSADAGADSDTGFQDADRPTDQKAEPSEANDSAIWTGLAEKWSGTREATSESTTTRWSQEELAVVASLDGAVGFPTVGPDLLAGMPASARDAVMATVIRSLAARDLIQLEDGAADFAGDLGSVATCALAPGLTVTVERISPTEHRGRWYGVGLDESIEVEILDDGTRACSIFSSGELVEQILATSGLKEPSTSTYSESGDVPSEVSLADVLDGSSSIDTLIQIQTTWRDGTVQVGGILTIALTAGVPAIAEAIEESPIGGVQRWQIEATDWNEVRRALVEHLPIGIQRP